LAFRSVKDLQDPASFRPWILRIAQNVAIDAARRDLAKKRFSLVRSQPATLDTMTDKSAPADDRAAQEETRKQILAILRSLPEEYRLPLTLRYISGADYETICMQLGLTNGSLRGLLHRGLKLLRSKLPEDFCR
jgi:RNA polymerase sigma-70 factor, ECF subfamily